MSLKTTAITVAFGDGIGPEIMNSVLWILKEAEAKLAIETIEVGEELYKKGHTSGISSDAWELIDRTAILLKAPITTPQGGGYKSLNVTLRKTLGLYANIRPTVSYYPFVDTMHPKINLVIVRENEEDLYAGIEYRQTKDMYESLKLISRTGSARIIEFAFNYAMKNNRSKLACFSKDNIMKFSDGIFHKMFDEIKIKYPNIQSSHHIIDIATADLSSTPEKFDVIVTSNLYGDIISDVAAKISGSVGLAGSANVGDKYSMFEAVHGSAPDIANQDIANPSGLLNAAIMMLVHIGQVQVASNIENAWKKTIEDGIHTKDIYKETISKKKVGTKEFAKSVIERLGEKPKQLAEANYPNHNEINDVDKKASSIISQNTINIDTKKELVGVDVFLDIDVISAQDIADRILKIDLFDFKLQTIATKGLKLWPSDHKIQSFPISDHWCCRFMSNVQNESITHKSITLLLKSLNDHGFDFIKIENLYKFDGVNGFTLLQGE
ncbi:MAG: NADP-dependent isocitrate dehydrogenase [Rickettsiaceae bacterium]